MYLATLHLLDILERMPELLLHGYLSRVDDTRHRLSGDNTTAWSNLGPARWKRGVCKHVNADKTECTFKIGANTIFENDGRECTVVDLEGCFVSILVRISDYTFFSDGEKITGWRITVKRMKRVSPLQKNY